MTQKQIIAVDVDEVLTPFVKHLIEYYNSFNDKKCIFEEFTTFHFADVWGCTNEESDQIVNDFFETEFFTSLGPIFEAFESLKALSDHFVFKVVTSRQHCLREKTENFLNRYFPGIFDEILLGNHYGQNGVKHTKPEMMEMIGAKLLIDDNLDYAKQCIDHGFKAILFGNYPWNVTHESFLNDHGIVRVSGWSEITKGLLEELLK